MMSDFATGQGYYLAELIKHYHRLREEYLEWAGPLFDTRTAAISTYQRSLLAWYEARILLKDPYAGEVMIFLRAATAAYTGTLDEFLEEWADQGLATLGPDPVRYLPRPVKLSARQEKMMAAYELMDRPVRDLLLLAYYHQLSDARLHDVLEVGHNADAASQLRHSYLRMLRDDWRSIGLMDDRFEATPEQQETIDRYLRDELDVAQRWEVEARRSSEPNFSNALQLREDWEEGLKIVGRNDTLETLAKEEERYRPKVVVPVNSSRWIDGRTLQGLLAGILAVVLIYLLYTTFAPTGERTYFAEYFRPFPNITRTQDSLAQPISGREDLAEMLVPYDRRDYYSAYDELLPAATAYPAAKLYLGVCALALEQPQRARDWLEQYLPGEKYHPYARWYIALAYLADERRGMALRELVDIAGIPGHPYEVPATRLIEALE